MYSKAQANNRHFVSVNTNQFINRVITLETAKKNINKADGVLRSYIQGDVDKNLQKKAFNNALNASRLSINQMEESGMITRALEELDKILRDNNRVPPMSQLQEIKEQMLSAHNTDPDPFIPSPSPVQKPVKKEPEAKIGKGFSVLKEAQPFIGSEIQKPIVDVNANLKVNERTREHKSIIKKARIPKVKQTDRKDKERTGQKNKIGGGPITKKVLQDALKRLKKDGKGIWNPFKSVIDLGKEINKAGNSTVKKLGKEIKKTVGGGLNKI